MPKATTGEPADNTLRNLTGTRFEKILLLIEKRLRGTLEEARTSHSHASTIGAKLESAVRHTLNGFLPTGYGTGHGFVCDAYGDCSKQADIIITNPENPLSYPDGEAGTYVIDGVSAVVEVKAVLNSSSLEDCLKKGSEFKRLRMSFHELDTVDPRQYAYLVERGAVPPFVVIAFESKIAIPTIIERLKGAGEVPIPAGKEFVDGPNGNRPQPPIDAVCLLGRAVLWLVRSGDPLDIKVEQTHDPVDVADGWVTIPTQAPLALSLAWLHMVMPKIRRGASVFVPYLMPYERQLAYLREHDSFMLPEGFIDWGAVNDGHVRKRN